MQGIFRASKNKRATAQPITANYSPAQHKAQRTAQQSAAHLELVAHQLQRRQTLAQAGANSQARI